MQLPLTLRPRPSFRLAAALVLAHGLAAAGLGPTVLPLAFKLLLWFGLALSLGFCLQRHVLRLPFRALTLRADGSLDLDRRDGTCTQALVCPQTTVLPWLCVLQMRLQHGSVALTLPSDALDAEAYRQLRLWLRWKTGSVRP